MNVFSRITEANGHVCDDGQMLEATNEVLISAWNEICRGILQNRITRSVLHDIQEKTEFASIKYKFESNFARNRYFQYRRLISMQHNFSPDLSSRLKQCKNQIKKSYGLQVPSKTDARMISESVERNIIILDVDKEEILTISSLDIRESCIELIYNLPCPANPGDHFDVYIGGKVVRTPISDYDNYDLLGSAINVAMGDAYAIYYSSQETVEEYITEHTSEAGRLLTIEYYAYQLKRARALLRLDMNHPPRQMNQCEFEGLDSSHLFSCIEQALKSEVSRLAKVLAEYESDSRSAERNSKRNETEMMTSTVSRDACRLFLVQWKFR